MKNIILLLMMVALNMGVVFGQTKDINTAKNYLNNYVTYDVAEGKTTSLEKARDAIDKAIIKVEEMQAAKDPKLKSKNVFKAYLTQARIYSTLAGLENSDLTNGAREVAVKAVENALKADAETERATLDGIIDRFRVDAFNEGVASYKAKDYEAAYSQFTAATDIGKIYYIGKEGVDTSSIAMTAYAAHNSGKTDEAIGLYNQLIDLEYNDENIYTSLSSLHMEKGDTEEAKAAILKGKERFPESNAFLINEINYLLKEGKADEAMSKMEKAIELNPDNASLYFALGSNYETLAKENGDKAMMDKAESYYKEALKIKPEYFDCAYNLGAFYFNQAAENLKKANDLPLSAQAEYDKLKADANDLFSTALPYFEKAESLNANDASTLIALKEIHANLGDLKKSGDYKKRFEALEK